MYRDRITQVLIIELSAMHGIVDLRIRPFILNMCIVANQVLAESGSLRSTQAPQGGELP